MEEGKGNRGEWREEERTGREGKEGRNGGASKEHDITITHSFKHHHSYICCFNF